MLAITAYFAGDPLQCLAHLEAVGTRGQTPEARRFAVEYGWDGELHRLAYETSAHFALGHFDQARSRCRDLLSLAEPGAEIYSITTALGHATYLAHELGELDTAEQLVERSMAIANEQQLPALLANTFCSRGFALVRRGFVHKGLTEIETGLTLLRAAGVVAVYGYHLLYLAQAHLEAGDVERGLAAIAEGLALCARHQARFHESELYRIEGELRIRRGEEAESVATLCAALAIARRRGARAFELRAATSLARLLRGAGRRDEARWILEPVFGAFREGFDTTDLRVARELLDGLSH